MKRLLIILAVVVLGTIGIVTINSASGGDVQGDNSAQIADDIAPNPRKISPEEVKVLLDHDDSVILLDVRTEEEFTASHIPGARNIPDSEIHEKAETELSDKDVIVIVYCRSGGRSAKAAQELADMGYINIYDLGGILSWPYETDSTK